MRHRDFRSLGEGLHDVARSLGGKQFQVQARIASEWARVVGREIAQHTHVSGLRSGELMVAVDSSVWATELSAMGTHLLERLNQALGQTAVKSVRFTVSNTVARAREEDEREEQARDRYGDKHVPPEPLTADELARLEELFADVRDERLREAALRAAVRDLEWKKGKRRAREA